MQQSQETLFRNFVIHRQTIAEQTWLLVTDNDIIISSALCFVNCYNAQSWEKFMGT